MVRFLPLLALAVSGDLTYDKTLDAGISLLQLKAHVEKAQAHLQQRRFVSHSNKTRSRDPRAAERKMCPHEIDEAAPAGDSAFGCKGTLKAASTVQCSTWGEPHVTATFPSPLEAIQNTGARIDVFYKPGHFRMAAAADGSWEVQMFNCGTYAVSFAARFGKDILEVIVNLDGDLEYYVNGKQTEAGSQVSKIILDSTHRHIKTDNIEPIAKETRPVELPGSCIDDPQGQVMIDFAQSKRDIANGKYNNNGFNNINIHIVAQSDAVTTKETDGNAICNEKNEAGKIKWHNWDSEPVPADESLFIHTGTRACEYCGVIPGGLWDVEINPGSNAKEKRVQAAKQSCSALKTGPENLSLESACATQNPPIPVADAERACQHLINTPLFYADCQLDFCFSGGQEEAVEEALAEEAVENPEPVCVGAAPAECDPAGLCCNSLREGATLILDNVVQNNICGTGSGKQELRFGRALVQNGVQIDLVIAPVGDYDCGSVTNERFGAKNAEIGLLAVQAGTEAEFEFSFVKAGTSELVAPQSLMISVLDLDQGKKGKQRESVTMCGGGGAVVTDDSELQISTNGDCTTVTSTTHGNGQDNPTSLAEMSQIQRGKTAAFPVVGGSFTAKLGVSKKGRNPRRFMFAGHPTVSCVLK